MTNAERAQQNRQSVLFSIEKGSWVQNEEFFSQLFDDRNLTITSNASLSERLRLLVSRRYCLAIIVREYKASENTSGQNRSQQRVCDPSLAGDWTHFCPLAYGPFFVSPRSFVKNPLESS